LGVLPDGFKDESVADGRRLKTPEAKYDAMTRWVFWYDFGKLGGWGDW
jgi:hypothetical protein